MRQSHSDFGPRTRHPTSQPLAVLAVGILLLGACTTWQRAQVGPAALVNRPPASGVRVVFHGGDKMVLFRPFIRSDSLGGFTDSAASAHMVMVPLQDVASLEVLRFSVGETALAVATIGAMGAVLVAALSTDGGSSSGTPPAPTPGWGGGQFSCPLIYSWDGRHWRLDSGTFGGAIVAALQRTDLDNLDHAQAGDGTLRLRVANELAETDHLDALAVLAVDHDPAVTVAPDPAGGIHTLGRLVPPLRARDRRNADALARVRDADGWNWESSVSGRDPGRADDLRDGLELAFLRPHGAARAHLVLDGNSSAWGTYLLGQFIRAHGRATQAWYDSMNARPAAALAIQARLAREAFLTASVRTAAEWRNAGMFWEAGPEVVKRQVLDLDLSQVAGDTVLVRLESAPSFWTIDRVAMDFTADQDVTVRELPLLAARDLSGREVAAALKAVDHHEYVLQHGDAALVTFAAPAAPAGRARSYLLRSTGWYHVDAPETGEPDVAALASVGRDSLAVGRASVMRLNAALAAMTGPAR